MGVFIYIFCELWLIVDLGRIYSFSYPSNYVSGGFGKEGDILVVRWSSNTWRNFKRKIIQEGFLTFMLSLYVYRVFFSIDLNILYSHYQTHVMSLGEKQERQYLLQ